MPLWPRTAATSWPAALPICAGSKICPTGSKRPRDGAGRTSHGSGPAGPPLGRSRRRLRASRRPSRLRGRQAPPRSRHHGRGPWDLDARVPVDRATERDEAKRQLAHAQRGDNKPNRRWRVHAPPSTRAGAFGGDLKASKRRHGQGRRRLRRAAPGAGGRRRRCAAGALRLSSPISTAAPASGRGGGRGAQTAQRHLGAVRRRPRPHSSRPGARPGRRPAGPPGRAARASAGLTRRSRRVVPPRPWYRGCP